MLTPATTLLSPQVKFLDVDKDTTRLVVSHRKAVVDSQIHALSVGSVVKGIVTAVKPYGAFVDIGGMSGLLHISQVVATSTTFHQAAPICSPSIRPHLLTPCSPHLASDLVRPHLVGRGHHP
jgi:hypothetical protein